MSRSLNDTVRSVEASIPGSRVLNAKHFANPAAEQAAERGTKAFSERVKRTNDEELGGQRHRPGHVAAKSWIGNVWWINVGVGADKATDDTGRYAKIKSADWTKRECMECNAAIYQHPWWQERVTWICEACRYKAGYLYETESGSKWRMQHSSMTLKHLGGMERSNENIGGIMGGHGAPEVAEAMRAAGVLQTRRDESGNPVETAVFSSRKDMESKLKLFNKMQREASDRGFRGTRGGVKYIAHGGNAPD